MNANEVAAAAERCRRVDINGEAWSVYDGAPNRLTLLEADRKTLAYAYLAEHDPTLKDNALAISDALDANERRIASLEEFVRVQHNALKTISLAAFVLGRDGDVDGRLSDRIRDTANETIEAIGKMSIPVCAALKEPPRDE